MELGNDLAVLTSSAATNCSTAQHLVIIIIIRIRIRNMCSAPFTDKIRTAVHYIVSKKQKLTIKSSVNKMCFQPLPERHARSRHTAVTNWRVVS